MMTQLATRPRRTPRPTAKGGWLEGLLYAGFIATLSGCNEAPYCFDDCGDDDAGSQVGAGEGSGLNLDGSTQPGLNLDSGAAACNPNADELCDGKDNDCDGEVDEGISFSSPRSCGNCSTDCSVLLANVLGPRCIPPAREDGTEAGSCEFQACAQDFYDIDPGEPGCEYFCDENPVGENTLDLGGTNGCGRDDDCDGMLDEDVDTCGDTENCGRCGHRCVILHGTAACESSAARGEACSEANTECVVASCDTGFHDANGSANDGCEYECDATGAEICDGQDNDCDGLIDNADEDLEDGAGIGSPCFGGTLGICGADDHVGLEKCIGGQVSCCDTLSNDEAGTNPRLPENGLRNGICDSESGAQVVRPGSRLEVCNGLDDDCDGSVDDSLTDVGVSCGTNLGNCTAGTAICDSTPGSATFGTLLCEGSTAPGVETCNGEDDDCDGVFDGIAVIPTVVCTTDADCSGSASCLPLETGGRVCALGTPDTGVACDIPPPVPAGTTSGCRPGATVCRGGQMVCEGAVLRNPSTPDSCGVDENCDGSVDNTDLTLVSSCGSCDINCAGATPNADWSCEELDGGGYACINNGCNEGWYNCDTSDTDECDTYCSPARAEVCNGIDDDCDCEIDEDITADPRSVCGVLSTANAGCNPEVTCTNGSWYCAFDTDICGGSNADCGATADDTCDNRDNDCDGVVDNVFVDQKGTACSKDLNGACQTQGVRVCATGGMSVECNATEPTPSTEVCNGLDDDCDGYVDETFADTDGALDGNFIRPEVVALSDTGPWVFAYEASRPDSTATSQGLGNGYVSLAPAGESLDATLPCSASNRLPWTNVSAHEVEQACAATGGRVCRSGEWTHLCEGKNEACSLGFLPTPQCNGPSDYDHGPYCNLAGYDADPGASGDQDSLIDTASGSLSSCASPWSGNFNNTLDAYDTTGNARELARCQKDRAVCRGGASGCMLDCCSGTSVATDDGRRLCGSLNDPSVAIAQRKPNRRLSGQPCDPTLDASSETSRQCCDNDSNCSTQDGETYGTCNSSGICRNKGVATSCVAAGFACTDSNNNTACDEYGNDTAGCCSDAPLLTGICGGPWAIPHATYPLLGGSYRSVSEAGALCSYQFFKVSGDFRLFDSGFRCCFDQDPRL